MEIKRAWSTRTTYLLATIGIAACSIYDPSLLNDARSSSNGGELGAETGGLPGKSEATGGASSTGGASGASGGSTRGGSTGGTEGGATGGSAAAGATTTSAGGDTGGSPASGGAQSLGGSGPSGGSGGSATGGATASGGVVSTQGGTSGSGGSTSGGTGSGGKSSTGGSNSGGAAGGSSCAGKLFQGLCWYLGERGESCDATCAAYGGVAPGAEAFVGTTAQGGSLTECKQLLTLLGVTTAPFLGSRDDVGLGCHLYDDEAFWLSDPAFTTDASVPEARIVCACR